MPQLPHYDFSAPLVAIDFDPSNHTYKLDGMPCVGMTRMMKECGLSPTAFYADGPHRERGKAIHRATNYIDDGTFDRDETSPVLIPYLDQYTYAIRHFGARPVPGAGELLVASRIYRVCGTLDNLWEVGNELWLVDLKTGSMPPLVGVQVAGYDRGLQETYSIKVDSRLALQLDGDGSRPVVKFFNESRWDSLFCATALIWHEREKHGLIYRKEKEITDEDESAE